MAWSPSSLAAPPFAWLTSTVPGSLPSFAVLLAAVGIVIVPLLGIAYVTLRTRLRRAAFFELFTQPDIGIFYLASRGRPIRQADGETTDAYRVRLASDCERFCLREFKGEFGHVHFVLPMILASVTMALVVLFLVGQGFGAPVGPAPPTAVTFALIGGLLWTLYVLFRDYARTDLRPASFNWISFRFVLALAIGLVADRLFPAAAADLGAFVLATIPFGDAHRFIRSKVPGLAVEEVRPPLTVVQGVDPETVERLSELGIHTVQQLAFVDPLRLMLGTNLSPKVLIDWIDQALLYIYVGDDIAKLRPRGIRGAIEMASLYREEYYARPDAVDKAGLQVIASVAAALSISAEEVLKLVRSLYQDNQVLTLWRLWGSLDPDQRAPALL
jgi:hypothetical protein